MTRSLLLATLCASCAIIARAAEPPANASHDVCDTLNNRILGPRTQNRPVPLLAGDETQGFRRACSVPWSTLSPRNEPVAVQACFRGNLLRVANDSACGKETGPLWVSTRWVVTSADLTLPKNRLAACQQLETGAWAGTRDFSIDCAQRNAAPRPDRQQVKSVVTPESAAPAQPAAKPKPPEP